MGRDVARILLAAGRGGAARHLSTFEPNRRRRGRETDPSQVAGELKDVPKEFQEGIKEGEAAKNANALPPAEEKAE